MPSGKFLYDFVATLKWFYALGWTCNHCYVFKKLIADFSNTNNFFTTKTCTNATNLHDRVTHPYDVLCAQYFGIDLS